MFSFLKLYINKDPWPFTLVSLSIFLKKSLSNNSKKEKKKDFSIVQVLENVLEYQKWSYVSCTCSSNYESSENVIIVFFTIDTLYALSFIL